MPQYMPCLLLEIIFCCSPIYCIYSLKIFRIFVTFLPLFWWWWWKWRHASKQVIYFWTLTHLAHSTFVQCTCHIRKNIRAIIILWEKEPYNHFHKLSGFCVCSHCIIQKNVEWWLSMCFLYPLWVFYTNLWYMFNHPFDTLVLFNASISALLSC